MVDAGQSQRQATSFESLFDGWPGLRSLLFDGYYPFFPVAGFFLLGLVLGHVLATGLVDLTLATIGDLYFSSSVSAVDPSPWIYWRGKSK